MILTVCIVNSCVILHKQTNRRILPFVKPSYSSEGSRTHRWIELQPQTGEVLRKSTDVTLRCRLCYLDLISFRTTTHNMNKSESSVVTLRLCHSSLPHHHCLLSENCWRFKFILELKRTLLRPILMYDVAIYNMSYSGIMTEIVRGQCDHINCFNKLLKLYYYYLLSSLYESTVKHI